MKMDAESGVLASMVKRLPFFPLNARRSPVLSSKRLLSVGVLLFSMAGCSSSQMGGEGTGGTSGGTGGSNASTGGTTGATGGTTGSSGGTTGSSGGTQGTGTGGSSTGGHAAGGTTGAGGSSTGGVVGSGGSHVTGVGGSASGSGGATTGSGGSAGGHTGTTGSGGMTTTGSGGSSTSASFKCDNLSLAPSTTGVAKPSGAAGGLKVLDWAGFKGAVSFTFDDNTPSQIPNYNALKATGAHFTWFVVGSWLSGNSSTITSYKNTIADGQELANHTYSHQSGGNQSDLMMNESFIMSNFGVNANSMAAPNCDQSWSSVAPSVLFQNRGPCSGNAATVAPRDSTSPFLLPAYLPATGEAASTMTASFQSGKWRIFVIHGFDSQNGTYQPVPIGNVTSAMTSAVSGGYWAEGITNVGAYWQGQKLISTSSTTSATWTLPAKFPKNMCLRVTTSGGTVTQKGQTIPWDDHGYYQISLDAGEVTVQ